MTGTDPYSQHIAAIHQSLGIEPGLADRRGWPLQREPAELDEAGPDCFGRSQRLTPAARAAWQAMQEQAGRDGVVLHLVSAFRSVDYQRQLIERKLAQGQSLDRILRVNAPPGYSEHHTGRAVDLGTDDCPPLEEVFEETPAFQWLCRHAGEYGFRLSYPRGNAAGIAYEPWHWCFHGGLTEGLDKSIAGE